MVDSRGKDLFQDSWIGIIQSQRNNIAGVEVALPQIFSMKTKYLVTAKDQGAFQVAKDARGKKDTERDAITLQILTSKSNPCSSKDEETLSPTMKEKETFREKAETKKEFLVKSRLS